VLSRAERGEWGPGDDVVFVHTGGVPTVFTADGAAIPG
jgi:1-aminocyclopropane-1-carboxylate deaminase/D-cysteine desulfhydrase-like pyridoxal-dependent ACC family enzyme